MIVLYYKKKQKKRIGEDKKDEKEMEQIRMCIKREERRVLGMGELYSMMYLRRQKVVIYKDLQMNECMQLRQYK